MVKGAAMHIYHFHFDAVQQIPRETLYEGHGWFACACPKYQHPVVATFTLSTLSTERHGMKADDINDFLLAKQLPVEKLSLNVKRYWPVPPLTHTPEHLPPSVEKSLGQAEYSFPIVGQEEPSAAMYRRTIEMAFKAKFPEKTGTLYARIKSLADKGSITKEVGEWADEVRLDGNGAVHDEDGIERESLEHLRAFTDAFLRYIFTLPEQVRLNRQKRTNVAVPVPVPALDVPA